VPGEDDLQAPDGLRDDTNIVLAAELWYYIKKHWCRELQRHIRGSAALDGTGEDDTAVSAAREDYELRSHDAGYIKYFPEDHSPLERYPSLQRCPRGEGTGAP
ncbi:MAG: hypothetical protein JSU90_03960, partial [Nitrospiraceae bacterium]